ncbi:MAG: restriction endonuclease subunit S [Alphaproteobacteria bacterium]|nr:restriction endonuclease subunit S [Alphaproteobacteria bacterium]
MNPRWPSVPLGEVASLKWRGEIPQVGKKYRLVGVQLWGKGAYVRETIDGSETRYSQLFRVAENDIIVNKIWARNGSISVIGRETHGTYGSSEFPTYVIDRTKLDPRWMYWFTRLPSLWKQCEELSRGTSGQNRLRPERFLEVRIPLPPLSVQQDIVARLDGIDRRLISRQTAVSNIDADLSATLMAVFSRITTGAPRSLMRTVAPLVRRPVEIEPEKTYHELGARSFGRGLFDKPLLKGANLTWQKLFRIENGDLVFSNIKAWEGAFAVASAQDHGKVGSHRYLTCVPATDKVTPHFLWYYLQTREGINQVQAASPGSADRNRTLSQKRLEQIEVPLPSLEVQRWFDQLHDKMVFVRARSKEVKAELDQLIPAVLARELLAA